MPFRKFLEKQEKHFNKGGKLEKFAPFYEMVGTFFYQTSAVSTGKTAMRDALDLKRIMITVVLALLPCIIMMFYNTGYQANVAIAKLQAAGAAVPFTWREDLLLAIGIGFSPESLFANMIHGFLYFIPIYVTVVVIGGAWELLFATIRKHEINESFLVTSLLFPMVLPPTIPIWQAAMAISFGIVFGKEIFGGTGKNIVNPALFSRAFLFFAYPTSMSGDTIWYPISSLVVDGVSGATPLAAAKTTGVINISWWDAFIGIVPGSMGETSVIACLIGAVILVWTKIGSLRIMLSGIAGLAFTVLLFNVLGGDTNPFWSVGVHWHLVLGGFIFGIVFMATDPVSASVTKWGKVIHGFMIGMLTALVRLVNPGYPEGVMLSILFCNVTIPAIDYYFIKRNIKRREVRCAS
ncbi:MAG: NADH:ubiquinone reductase (Na(+)-transporting) subunit B [Deferribacteraceae bacterium]|jgi:Na+-transporting NADH:ubiquinone oxidoreductase subunit B|nr:NADH:ubiquinone reductase (Na(+)-transporting) subunit B [Deferribacteraceae bacterium]